MRFGWPLLLLCASCSSGPAIAPEAIVSNNPCIDGVLAEIAAPGQIGAVSSYSHDAQSASAPLAWARALPAIGTTAEEIIATQPRLVLTGNLASSGTNAALAKAGIKTVGIGVPANVDESIAQVRHIASAIGRQAAGERLVRKISTSVLPQKATSKSAVIWQNGGFVAGRGTLQDDLLTRAGYRNASRSYGLKSWDMLPLEILIRTPPDIVFMPLSAKGEDARALAARLRMVKHLGQRTQIVNFPDKLLFCGGPTIIKAMAALR